MNMMNKWIAVALLILSLPTLTISLAAEKHSHEHGSAGDTEHEAMDKTVYTCPMHPEVLSNVPGSCPKCGMKLVEKDKKHAHAEPTITASFRTDGLLTVGRPVQVTVKLLKKDGIPVLLSDLRVAHTKKIHLLIIDTSLTDYHHEHPVATDTDGEYTFTITPQKPGPYRVWVDLLPEESGIQEYVMADIESPKTGEPLTDRKITNRADLDGLTYSLSWDQTEIVKGRAVMGKLTIADANGQPFKQLEPVMGAYAHIVGFSEDFKKVVHIHPMGKEPENATDRGGPELEFHLVPEDSGFIRLFAQVMIHGESKFVPFGIEVNP